MSHAKIPSSYWSYAILIAVTLINLLPTPVLDFHFPWSKLHSSPPDISQLKVFRCACYPNLRSYAPYKLTLGTKECIFLGYPVGTKGYLCLDFETKHLCTSRHVIFYESKFPFSYITLSQSLPTSSPLSSDLTWFSNQLFLHSTNQPSLLGPYPVLAPSTNVPNPTSSTNISTSIIPHSELLDHSPQSTILVP